MAIRIALHHKTSYRYDRLVALSPHEVRLRPAPHARTPILSYSLSVQPEQHFINWQQDPYGNYIGRFVFPEKADHLEFTVDLVADMTVINPFDFFVEKYAETFPFSYPAQLTSELSAYLQAEAPGPLQAAWVAKARADLLAKPMATNDFLVTVISWTKVTSALSVKPETGAADDGMAVQASGIWPSLASMPEVGSRPIQPAPGMNTSVHACRSVKSTVVPLGPSSASWSALSWIR